MTIATLIGGAYTGTLGGTALGISEQGFNLVLVPKAERIEETDAYGLTLIDFFFRGVDCSTVVDFMEYRSGTITSAWPWGTLGAQGIIARLGSAIAGSMVLTAVSGTPAASSPASLTAARSVLEPGHNVTLAFNSKLRKVPIRYVHLPSDGAVHFTTS